MRSGCVGRRVVPIDDQKSIAGCGEKETDRQHCQHRNGVNDTVKRGIRNMDVVWKGGEGTSTFVSSPDSENTLAKVTMSE